jgi:hypothetical protein
MAEAITVTSYRQRLAAQMAGGDPAKPIAYMAFGDGGHNADLSPKSPLPDSTQLANELLRKPLALVANEDPLSATGRGILEASELVGARISEAALFDSDGLMVGLKTFSPKFKESDERYEINIKLRF